ncbi:hypothetical protein [Bradyrhizobium sp. CCBAU 51627]|uniref:hypothetical protein n=1 Tax=Bradyrhizobium sp. CCBAU 51627 TaxID=1325088 RepID=UPI002306C9BC|nr:hypothetical protein [Bradyrhizobium sp. CCBAU 51627]MDA9433495.1 hypothetical protein [Bradyrhizobium sp. CCBAU 51627]
MQTRFVAAGALLATILMNAHAASAQGAPDVTPRVLPDRIDDVPDADGSPFPRFDNFSWRAFIALNWPALEGPENRGMPDRTKKPGSSGPRVWETYKARYEVFAPGAPEPKGWTSYEGANPCGGVDNKTKTLSAFSHFADYNQASFVLGRLANPLIDQSKMYTRYEVRFSREQFESIVDPNNKWYIKQNLPTAAKPGTFKDGSVEIKAAWRVLNPGDGTVRSRFYINKAMVFDPVATDQQGTVVCNEHEIALVGFHIVIKTKLRPQWIWSSFEHVDNVPPRTDEPDAKAVPVRYSFNSGLPPQVVSPMPAPGMISETNRPDPNLKMQVIRAQPIQPETMQMNRNYWNLPDIKETVWANYMLVMTQWPRVPGTPGIGNAGTPFPTGVSSTLANTTMETYQQRNGRSCIECHQEVSNSLGRDFVAFMGFDATDPVQQAIAATAFRASSIRAANATRNSPSLESVRGPSRTALDDDPSVQALVRVLQEP